MTGGPGHDDALVLAVTAAIGRMVRSGRYGRRTIDGAVNGSARRTDQGARPP
ncbi:MAG TPA: hypothetical protein PLG75_11775 [Methanoculleus sp.]|nr:hypothetical protein [Methanoculleus sp.]